MLPGRVSARGYFLWCNWLAGNLTQHIDNELGISYNFEYNGQKYFYRKNLQGDIIGIYDSCWNLLGQYEYDAWGNLLSQVGSEILNINPFRYRGYYCDTESGIYYLNSRYYDPVIGRFISPDSLDYLEPETCNGLNLYAYCGNNPVMFFDPTGHGALLSILLVSLGIGLLSGISSAIGTAINGGSWNEVLGTFVGDSITGFALSFASLLGGSLAVGTISASIGHIIAAAAISTAGSFALGTIAFYAENSIKGNHVDLTQAINQGIITMFAGVTSFTVGYLMGTMGLWDSLKPGNKVIDIIKGSANFLKMEAGYNLARRILISIGIYLEINVIPMIIRSIIKYFFLKPWKDLM